MRYLPIAFMFLILSCTSLSYADTRPAAAEIEKDSTLISQWETKFQNVDYATKLQMIKEQIVMCAKAEKAVLNGISEAWHVSIITRPDWVSSDMARGLAEAERDGYVEIYKNRCSSLKKAMSEISESPSKYSKTYDMLLELFSIYAQIYSLARAPEGSYITFNQKINDLSSEFDKCLSKVEVLLQ